MKDLKVSVVIPAYNEEKYIEGCLKSVLAQSVKPDEIIVVDNNSTDNTAEIVRKYPVRLLKEINKGITPARNRGFNAAKYPIIIRTDADTIVPVDWVKKIKKHFEDEDVIAFSGPNYFYDIPDLLGVSDWPSVVFFMSFRKMCGHDCLYGPNLAIRKTVWEKAKNKLCEDDSEVHEDVDLALHIAKYGKIVFDRSLIVNTSPRRFKKLKPYLEYPYRYIKTFKKHHQSIIEAENSGIMKKVVPPTKRLLKALSEASLRSL